MEDFIELLKEHQDALLIPGGLLNKSSTQDYVGMTVAMTGTLFFRNSYDAEVRKALIECFEEWEAFAKPALRWLWFEGLKGPVPYEKAPPFAEVIKDEASLSLGYYAGEQPHDASGWHFRVLGKKKWQAEMGTWGTDAVRFSIPVLASQEHPNKFQELFVNFARRLRALHGLGGYGFVLSPTRAVDNHPAEAAFAVKLHGVEAGGLVEMVRPAQTGIKSVSWLTAVGDEFLDKLGGVDGVRSDLPPRWYAFYDYGAGVVIQAGNEPDLAAVDDNPMPPLYVLANAALRDVRAPTIGRFHQQLDVGRFTLATVETAKWLARFDTDDLADYQQQLQSVPRLRDESRLPR